MKIECTYAGTDLPWLRGNLHAHSTRSDGALPPAEVVGAYDRLRYDFLAISDHDLLVPTAELQPLTSMTMLPADEVTAHGPHMLAVGIHSAVAPHADRQAAINEAIALGGIAILNHPNWQTAFTHWKQETLEQLTGYTGIEIFNGVVERSEGAALATDRWDRLLSTGRRVFGFAHDDMHIPERDLERGWLMVQSRERNAASVLDAIRTGAFYASTGVTVQAIRVEDGVLRVVTHDAGRIRFIASHGRELAYRDAAEASYAITGEEGGYVRAECFGDGAKMAWTQPVWISAE